MQQLQYIEINGRTPYECGYEYGLQARDKILAGVEDYKNVFSKGYGKTWDDIKAFAMGYLPLLEKELPEEVEEVKGIAAGAGISLADVMVLNCRYEITKFPKPKECTTAAVMPEAAKEGKTFLFKNWDYRVGIMDNVVVLHITQPDGSRIIGIGEAGQLLRDGMNTSGVAIVSNNLQSAEDSEGIAVPTCFMRRHVLKSKSFEDACDYIRAFSRRVSCNTMVASADGRAIDFEVYPSGADEIVPYKGVLTHANHFVVQPKLQILDTSPRDQRLRELLMKKHSEINVPYIKLCMADHENYPKAICRHPADPSLELSKRSITVACEIYDFMAGEAHICSGPPCTGEFRTYKL
ncbi:MAG: C45 family peptidase [Clostridiaceae bacterium]|nr:C45 family peptidase [Clostridiaceae bacterium]